MIRGLYALLQDTLRQHTHINVYTESVLVEQFAEVLPHGDDVPRGTIGDIPATLRDAQICGVFYLGLSVSIAV